MQGVCTRVKALRSTGPACVGIETPSAPCPAHRSESCLAPALGPAGPRVPRITRFCLGASSLPGDEHGKCPAQARCLRRRGPCASRPCAWVRGRAPARPSAQAGLPSVGCRLCPGAADLRLHGHRGGCAGSNHAASDAARPGVWISVFLPPPGWPRAVSVGLLLLLPIRSLQMPSPPACPPPSPFLPPWAAPLLSTACRQLRTSVISNPRLSAALL